MASVVQMSAVIFVLSVMMQYNLVTGTVNCYQCNSGAGFDGPNCAINALPALAPFNQMCPSNAGLNYTHCRKQIQIVEGDTRIIRSCATAGVYNTAIPSCSNNLGTARVSVTYCECSNNPTTPTTPCNSSVRMTQISLTSILLILGAITLMSYVRRM